MKGAYKAPFIVDNKSVRITDQYVASNETINWLS